MSSSSSFLVLLIACVWLQTIGATRLPRTIDSAELDLLRLNELIAKKHKVEVGDVVRAYRAYAHLYARQAELASTSGEENGAYGRINEILNTPGLQYITESLFEPLHGSESLGERHLNKVKAAIREMEREWDQN